MEHPRRASRVERHWPDGCVLVYHPVLVRVTVGAGSFCRVAIRIPYVRRRVLPFQAVRRIAALALRGVDGLHRHAVFIRKREYSGL